MRSAWTGHANKLKKLNRPADQRKALLRGLTTELIRHGRIKTTTIRCKELRKTADHIIQLAKGASASLSSTPLPTYPHPPPSPTTHPLPQPTPTPFLAPRSPSLSTPFPTNPLPLHLHPPPHCMPASAFPARLPEEQGALGGAAAGHPPSRVARPGSGVPQASPQSGFPSHATPVDFADGSLHARRQALGYIYDKQLVHALFEAVPERYADRNGGYTRVLSDGFRRGDNAAMSTIELL